MHKDIFEAYSQEIEPDKRQKGYAWSTGKHMDKKEIVLRKASLADAEQILAIYRYYIEKTAITFEWDVPSIDEFKKRMTATMKTYPYLVALIGDKLVGYAYAGTFKARKAYDWSVETSIYVDKDYERLGIGKALYKALEEVLKKMHILNVNACITYPKEEDEYVTKDSARFHEYMGYQLVGRFHDSGYKFGRWYDMIWMEKMLGSHREQPEAVIPYPKIKCCL
ncbi:MAG: N-acetyltransferase family protein [Veillonellaceae bacterium]|nr:N-acetyltransferase family protein [Veillonellaceae bacterium]